MVHKGGKDPANSTPFPYQIEPIFKQIRKGSTSQSDKSTVVSNQKEEDDYSSDEDVKTIDFDKLTYVQEISETLNTFLNDDRVNFQPVYIQYRDIELIQQIATTSATTRKHAWVGGSIKSGGTQDQNKVVGTLINAIHLLSDKKKHHNPNILRDLKEHIPQARKRMGNPIIDHDQLIKNQLLPPKSGCNLEDYTIFICSVFREIAHLLPQDTMNATSVTINGKIKVYFGIFGGKIMAMIKMNNVVYEIYSPMMLVRELNRLGYIEGQNPRVTIEDVNISIDDIVTIEQTFRKVDIEDVRNVIQQSPAEIPEDVTVHTIHDVTIVNHDTSSLLIVDDIPEPVELLESTTVAISHPSRVSTLRKLVSYT